MALATMVMAAAPRTPTAYSSDWTRCRVDEIRSTFVARQRACRLNDRGDGWVHDRFGTGWMLQTDALSAILFVVVALFVPHKINAARAQGLAADNGRVG